jgi:hypothetical protein
MPVYIFADVGGPIGFVMAAGIDVIFVGDPGVG